MEDVKNRALLTDVFRDVFRAPSLELSDALSAGDMEDWDSLRHMVLFSAIEERFGRELYDQVLEEERETRQGVLARLRGRE